MIYSKLNLNQYHISIFSVHHQFNHNFLFKSWTNLNHKFMFSKITELERNWIQYITEDLKRFYLKTSVHSKKLQRTPKSFCLYGLYLFIFSVLEIWEKIYICIHSFKRTLINPLRVNIKLLTFDGKTMLSKT